MRLRRWPRTQRGSATETRRHREKQFSVSLRLRGYSLPVLRSLSVLPKRFPELLEHIVDVSGLRDVVRPPRVVAFGLAWRQLEQALQLAQRCGTIASTAREGTQRNSRRLGGRVQHFRVGVRAVRVVEMSLGLFGSAEKQLAVIPQQQLVGRGQGLAQLRRGLRVPSEEKQHATEPQAGLRHRRLS